MGFFKSLFGPSTNEYWAKFSEKQNETWSEICKQHVEEIVNLSNEMEDLKKRIAKLEKSSYKGKKK